MLNIEEPIMLMIDGNIKSMILITQSTLKVYVHNKTVFTEYVI